MLALFSGSLNFHGDKVASSSSRYSFCQLAIPAERNDLSLKNLSKILGLSLFDLAFIGGPAQN
jgi:hypothetical protein